MKKISKYKNEIGVLFVIAYTIIMCAIIANVHTHLGEGDVGEGYTPQADIQERFDMMHEWINEDIHAGSIDEEVAVYYTDNLNQLETLIEQL